ncbi:MAG: GYD domain-containing protein [Acidobacteria bacterium]|nr:GYD domain-containing protein [Acidobacteriota bacterium]
MPTYITLAHWTQQGVEKVKDSPARLDAARKAFKALGADLKGFYLTMGRYDFVLITEAPNDETAAKAALAVASQGNVRTETLRAFTEDEYRKLLGSL